MTNEEKMLKIIEKLAADRLKKEDVKKRYKDKDKINKLTDEERIKRLEELVLR